MLNQGKYVLMVAAESRFQPYNVLIHCIKKWKKAVVFNLISWWDRHKDSFAIAMNGSKKFETKRDFRTIIKFRKKNMWGRNELKGKDFVERGGMQFFCNVMLESNQLQNERASLH